MCDIVVKKFTFAISSPDEFLLILAKVNVCVAICYRPSVCLSVVCLSVTLVHPTQPVEIFGNIFSPSGTMAIHWHSLKILLRSSQGNPSVGGFKRKRGSEIYEIFHIWDVVSPKRCQIGGKLVLITNRKSSMSFRLVPKSVTLNDLERQNGHYFCVIFTEFGNFRGVLRKSGWQSHNYGQFTITMSSSKRLQRYRATPTA